MLRQQVRHFRGRPSHGALSDFLFQRKVKGFQSGGSTGITGSLFSGTAPVPAPTGSDTSSAFPLWLQTDIYNLTGAANNLASTPYSQFPGAQVYTPSDQTQQAWSLAGSNVGNWQPDVSSAQDYTASAGSPLSTQTALGYASPYSNGTISGLGSNLASGLNTGALSGAQGYYNSYVPNVTAGGSNIASAGNQATLGALGSYLGAYGTGVAGTGGALANAYNTTTQGAINSYMNPAIATEVGGVESALNQNFQQNLLPQISSQFVGAGQAGSPQQAQADSEAAYQTTQAIGQQIAPLYAGAYNTALGAAQQAANTGYGLGNTGYTGALGTASGMTNLGYGSAASGESGALNAGLSTANTGLGTATGAYNTGLSTGLSEQGIGLSAGAQEGQLGALTSELGAVDTSQLAAAGQAQDTLSQANINAALNNFYQQQQYPYQNLAFVSDIERGLPYDSSTQTAQTTYPSTTGASPLAAGIGTVGLTSALGLRRGGALSHMLRRPANDRRKVRRRRAA